MKKLVVLFMGTLFIYANLYAQAYESTIQYDKKKQIALAMDYPYPIEAVENAVISKMEQLGYKVKVEKGLLNKDKGFMIYKNSYVTDISTDKTDYILKVERKSRKEKDDAVLYLIMNKNGANAMDIRDSTLNLDKAKLFLTNLLPAVEAADLEIQIKDQQETLVRTEKKLSGLKDDQASLEKKLRENKSSQETTQKELEAQKHRIELLIGKRKPVNK